MKVYLFGLLSDLEVRLGQVIHNSIPEKTLWGMTLGGSTHPKHKGVLHKYQEHRGKGVELPLVAYLYLPDFVEVIRKEGLYGRFGYQQQEYTDIFKSFNELRNQVAHPVQSIITHPAAVGDLWCTIDRLEEAIFRLRTATS